MTPLFEALMFQAGYNAALVAVGATLLGIAAGVTGTFLFLRKRALVSDAVAHATLPGIGLAFLIMVALGLDGRNLIVLMLGALVTAVVGFFLVEWISRRTRLAEDAAIGAVLSVFFGFGVVLLTVIQTLSAGLHRRDAFSGCSCDPCWWIDCCDHGGFASASDDFGLV